MTDSGKGRVVSEQGGAAIEQAQIALLSTSWNPGIVGSLTRAARARLLARGVAAENIREFTVPGAFEIPLLAERLARAGETDAIVTLGCVIKGDTAHFEYVAGECARGIAEVSRQHGIPVGFGVLATYDEAQALSRSADDEHNKGIEAADAVLDMLILLDGLDD